MWLFTKRGFYSITVSIEDPTVMQVRARERRDLENLIALTGVDAEITETPASDYRYRIFLSPNTTAGVVMQLAQDITYSNFKGAVSRTPDQAHKEPGLHRIWAIHHGWQLAEGARARAGEEPGLFAWSPDEWEPREGDEALPEVHYPPMTGTPPVPAGECGCGKPHDTTPLRNPEQRKPTPKRRLGLTAAIRAMDVGDTMNVALTSPGTAHMAAHRLGIKITQHGEPDGTTTITRTK